MAKFRVFEGNLGRMKEEIAANRRIRIETKIREIIRRLGRKFGVEMAMRLDLNRFRL